MRLGLTLVLLAWVQLKDRERRNLQRHLSWGRTGSNAWTSDKESAQLFGVGIRGKEVRWGEACLPFLPKPGVKTNIQLRSPVKQKVMKTAALLTFPPNV